MELLNTALPALGQAFFLLLQPAQLGFLFIGVVLGPVLDRKSVV